MLFVRVRGIEPPTAAWKAAILPVNYTRKREDKGKFTFIYTSSAVGESHAYTHKLLICVTQYSENTK